MRKIRIIRFLLLFFLIAFSVFSVYAYFKYWTFPLQIFAFLLMFCIVGTFPVCKRCESTWIYVLTLFVSIPLNIRIAMFALGETMADEFSASGFHLFYIIVWCMGLLSIEELLFGVIARLIWHRQQIVVKREKPKEKIKDFSKM